MLLGSAQHRANKKNEEDIFHSTYSLGMYDFSKDFSL